MRTAKIIVFILIIIVVVAAIIGFFLPSEVEVERTAVINAPAADIFNEVNTLKNWEHWSPWHTIDTAMKIVYRGPASGEGASYEWSSNNRNVGNGTLTIIESKPESYIKVEMDFHDKGMSYAYYKFEPATGGGTKVTWKMESDLGDSPFSKLMGPMMKLMIGNSFEKGLNNIKERVENPSRPVPI